jgi:hypothetical protein
MISQVITFEQASRDQVVELAREWPAAYVECRMDRHEWRPSSAKHYPGFRYFHVIKVCHRCRTEKHQEIGEAGQLFASTYRYPTGYLTNGRGRIIGDARDALRLESIKRSFKIVSVDEPVDVVPLIGTRRGLGMTNGH